MHKKREGHVPLLIIIRILTLMLRRK